MYNITLEAPLDTGDLEMIRGNNMDGLSSSEFTDLFYASQSGNMISHLRGIVGNKVTQLLRDFFS